MRRYYFMLAAATALLLTACNNRQETRAGDEVVPDTLTYIADDSEPAPAEERTGFQPRPVTSRPAPQRPRVVRPAPVKAEPETMYVETYGAQGKVWGHVTMNGDTGNGTIHDADENTLTEGIIEAFKDKWNWHYLSHNGNVPMTDELLEKYADRWDWEQIIDSYSQSIYDRRAIEFYEKYKDYIPASKLQNTYLWRSIVEQRTKQLAEEITA